MNDLTTYPVAFDEGTHTSDTVTLVRATSSILDFTLANTGGVSYRLSATEGLELKSTGLALSFALGKDFNGSATVTLNKGNPKPIPLTFEQVSPEDSISITVTVEGADCLPSITFDPKIKVIRPTLR